MEADDLTSSDDNHSCCGGGTSGRISVSHHSKTGRKGDPRMHRAVGARLGNPKISLFEALRIGGFHYMNDDDANAIDSEQITLGQRKNQLSRRLRLTQKPQPVTNVDLNSQGVQNSPWPSQVTSIFPGKKRSISSSALEERVLSDDPAMRLYHTLTLPEGDRCESPIRAKQHPDYHPLVVPLLHHRSYGIIDTSHASPTNPKISHHSSQLQNSETCMAPRNETSDPRLSMLGGLVSSNSSSYGGASITTPQFLAHGPSHVAINSLSQTAASLGWTLEQLALALQNSHNLSKILIVGGSAPSKEQKQLALTLYQSENRSLYQRAMLLAGYPLEVVKDEERSIDSLRFMWTAWQQEGERLSALWKQVQPTGNHPQSMMNGPFEEIDSTCCKSSDDNQHSHHDHLDTKDKSRDCDPSHHDHTHSMDRKDDETSVGGPATTSRHIHRLEGKCGHLPVLHQPAGGKPHIDFVIGDRVECYHGVPTSQGLLWPSNFSCEDVSCHDASCRDLLSSSKGANEAESNLLPIELSTSGGDPIVYERSELDFESDEWNFDFAASEKSLLGLVRLGGDTQDPSTNKTN